MSLAERAKQHTTGKGGTCSVCLWERTTPDDLAAEFNDALADPTVETQALWAVLVAECPDLPFKAHTLRRHRAGHR